MNWKERRGDTIYKKTITKFESIAVDKCTYPRTSGSCGYYKLIKRKRCLTDHKQQVLMIKQTDIHMHGQEGGRTDRQTL